MSALSATDPTSFSNPDKVVVTHIDLDLDVDFDRHVLAGEVHLTLDKLADGVDTVILDTRDVTVQGVTDKQTGQQLQFSLGDKLEAFGSKLEVKLPTSAQKSCDITIKYETSPECSALQWLRAEQTAGKRQPYLFSQCQAIHCRSMIPCQDTPYVKCTYTAKISAPKDIKILMSALLEGSKPSKTDPSKSVYSFRQKTPMPSYLIAIVGGDIVSRVLGPRSKVWSEPELVEQSAYEFGETEQMLQTAENLLGPYVWGHYDLLVLPPSFPYGGMENPCLTFVTPTLLAGDRSLADVVAHEISHSWTGNLVTNKTWDDFWLNEGNTMFVERKIAGRLVGDAGEQLRQFKALCGWNTLIETRIATIRGLLTCIQDETVGGLNEGNTKYVERKIVANLKRGEKLRQFLAHKGWTILTETVDVLGKDHAYTKLVQDTKGVDPDDSFSSIPYEKGHALLFYLEQLLGGPDVFEPFMKKYIDKFKYKSITTADWKDFLFTYFHEQAAAGVFDAVDWEGWLHGVGMPPVKPRYDMTLAESCEKLAKRWLDSSEEQLSGFTYSDIEEFLPVQTEQFLAAFLNNPPLSHAKIVKMRDIYRFDEVQNSEIKFRWLRVCIKAQYEPAIKPALQFVTDQGRMKFVRPIYRDLYNLETSRAQAVSTFQANRDQMHGTTVNTVAKVLQLA